MMTKEYILEHNLLEQYLLGDLDASTHDAIEEVLLNSSEIKAIYEDLELNLELLSQDHATEPPKDLKEHLVKTITQSQSASKVISMPQNKYKALFSLTAAACVILFFNTIFLIVKNGGIAKELTDSNSQTEQLKQQQQNLLESYSSKEQMLALLSHPDTEQHVLTGNDKSPNSKLVSFINHEQKLVIVNTSKMPELDQDHDYQLWADVEGEMINMGLIDLGQPLLAMTYITDAESLNITIEPKGGSDHPTVANLIANTYL